MFIKNTQKEDVYLRSHEGYIFCLSPGISAIWDSAGEALLKVHKIESKGGVETHRTSSGVLELSQGHGIPALSIAEEEDWIKEGRKFAKVERFKINFKLIPRKKLIPIALERGLSHQRVTEFQMDESIDTEVIASEINKLEVPENIKYPHSLEEDAPQKVKEEEKTNETTSTT